MKEVATIFTLVALLVVIPPSKSAPATTNATADRRYVTVGRIAAARRTRQVGFNLAEEADAAASRTGFGGTVRALADAQTADPGFGPGYFGYSGANANANSFGQNFGGFDYSSANANANAFSQGFGPNGFGSSAANAQAQSFQSGGPLGSFGASAANSGSQGFNVGPGGLTGSASFGGSQTYNLPGDRDLSISYLNGFAVGEDGLPTYSGGHAISVNGFGER